MTPTARAVSADHNDRRRLDDLEPPPGFGAGRALSDDEVRHLGYRHRDGDGWWVNLEGCRSGGSTLTPEERAARERQSQRLSYALRHAPHVVNPNAMRDALCDTLGDRPTIGAIRRDRQASTPGSTGFDWGDVRRRVDAQHAADIQRVINPPSPVDVATPKPIGLAGTGNRTAESDRAYGIVVLDAECWRVARTPKGNRRNTLVSAAFKVADGSAPDSSTTTKRSRTCWAPPSTAASRNVEPDLLSDPHSAPVPETRKAPPHEPPRLSP